MNLDEAMRWARFGRPEIKSPVATALADEIDRLRVEVGAIADELWHASSEGPVLDLVGKLRAVVDGPLGGGS